MPFADYKDFADCVAKNQDKDDPKAYCATIQEKAEGGHDHPHPHRHAEFRHLTLRVLGKARKQMWHGREHYVVPVVALMEGVIHAVNAETPEFVPYSTLSQNVSQWNGRPLMLGHPVKDGIHIAANAPSVLEGQCFGSIFNARADPVKRRLLVDAYVDPERLKALNRLDVLERVAEGGVIEVSVGANVATDTVPGVFNGKAYKASWKALGSDHLAFIPDGRGACSVEMGCGAHRAACANDETDEVLTVEEPPPAPSLITAVTKAVRAALGVKKVAEDCPMCQGSGSHNHNPCDACDGTGVLKAAQEGDTTMDRKKMLDKLTSCACSGFTTADLKMLEAASDERLVAFVAAADSAAKAKEDEEAAAAAAKKKEDDEKDKVKAAEAAKRSLEEKVTALETELRAASEKQLTEAEFNKRAPDSIRALLADKQAQDAAEQATLITSLKAASDKGFTEAELKAMALTELRKLAAFAKVDTVVDYSGRGLPVLRSAATGASVFAPPDGYAAALAARK